MVVTFLTLVLCLGLYHAQGAELTLLTEEPQATVTKELVVDNKIPITSIIFQGAMCLDGSSPGYYMRAGSGDGANKWVLHLMGGAWCYSTNDCYLRSLTLYGSTTLWNQTREFYGVLSNDATVNPDFHNWNAVFFIYCDGGSFAGDKLVFCLIDTSYT